MEALIQLIALKPILAIGLVIGLALKTLVPWLLKGADRGRFDPKYHWNWILTAAVGFGPVMVYFQPTGIVWKDLVAGALIAFGMQTIAREYVTKPLEKPAKGG